VLHRLGTERAFVVHGAGIDELPLDGSGVIHEVDPSGVHELAVDPVALGLASVATAELAGGTPDENARFVEGVLAGQLGPRRDVVLLNAAAGLTVAGRTASLGEGVALARRTIEEGAPMRLLGALRDERATHERETAEAEQGAPA
jgi:anthranilate phosphoribosyltransferase